jgi:hypothetical protein
VAPDYSTGNNLIDSMLKGAACQEKFLAATEQASAPHDGHDEFTLNLLRDK